MRLTDGTLWAMAANEYETASGRAGPSYSPLPQGSHLCEPAFAGKGGFSPSRLLLPAQADRQGHESLRRDNEGAPIHPLAPEARLRLIISMLSRRSRTSPDELESLGLDRSHVWPKDETYWQKKTAQIS